MKFKQWSNGLKGMLALLLALPLVSFGVVAWFGRAAVKNLNDMTKRVIDELPSERSAEWADLLVQATQRAEVISFFVPLACAAVAMVVSTVVFGRFFANLSEDCTKVLRNSNNMSELGQHLKHISERISLGSTQSGIALEQSIGSLERFSGALQRTAVDVAEADKAARLAVEQSTTGELELKTVLESLSELASQSRRLEEIITVIDSIAFQTNILAVNAAVEAARAGEQGRGFAIVAEAVRNLAQNSAASAKNISALIRESAETSKRAQEAVRNGSNSLGTSANHVRKSQALIQKISTSTSELSDALVHMSQSMSQLDSISKSVFSSADWSDVTQERFAEKIGSLLSSTQQLRQACSSVEVDPRDVVEPVQSATSSTPALNSPKMAGPQERSAMRRAQTALSTTPQQRENEVAQRPVRLASDGVSSTTAKAAKATKLRARDVIPFEGETESERTTEVKLGTTSGF